MHNGKKIAGISMTYNDGYKLNEWISHYKEYINELDYYVVVDNGSERAFVDSLYSSFPNAIIIERKDNGGCTAAYNDGIKYALDNTDADQIIIIGNDIRLSRGCIGVLSEYLSSDKSIGIVTSAMLHINSDVVDHFGVMEGYFGSSLCENGKKYDEIKNQEKETDLYGGGLYMFNRELCKTVGFQDEKLFMYSDEIDMAIRTRKAGYRVCVTSKSFAWHWHINEPGQKHRKPASKFLSARNRIYISKKYYTCSKTFIYFLYYSFYLPLKWLIQKLFRRSKVRLSFSNILQDSKYSFIGAWFGIFGNMKYCKYMIF